MVMRASLKSIVLLTSVAFLANCDQATSTAPPSDSQLSFHADAADVSDARRGMYSPTSDLGVAHVSMYNNFGADCTGCHNGLFQNVPPNLKDMKMKKVRMAGNKACVTCHTGDKAPLLFISLMNTQTPAYGRCEDCHLVK